MIDPDTSYLHPDLARRPPSEADSTVKVDTSYLHADHRAPGPGAAIDPEVLATAKARILAAALRR